MNDKLYFDITLNKVQQLQYRDFLSRHEVKEKHRAKIIDWMLEVFVMYKQRNQTLFRAYFILDMYFYRCTDKVTPNDLYLLGIVCVFIASKVEEIEPLNLQ